MATAVDSTPAPVVQTGLLPLVPFDFRPAAPLDDPRSAEELLEEIRRAIEGQEVEALPDLLPQPLLPGAPLQDDAEGMPAAARPELPPEPLIAAARHARAIHARRTLERAVEHGTALLAALGLPCLVRADFVALDRAAIGDALDRAISHLDALDALDAPAEDLEEDDPAEDDDPLEMGGDDEQDLGWAADVSQLALGHNTADGDETALERHGTGFVRSGPDDAEDDGSGGAGGRGAPWWERPAHHPARGAPHG